MRHVSPLLILILVNVEFVTCCLQGACRPGRNKGLCLCDDNHESKICDIQPNTCHASTCLHGGCMNKGSNQTCSCTCQNSQARRNMLTEKIATDCYDIKRKSIGTTSGVYSVRLWKTKQVIDVYCDMDTDEGGWTVFQRRFDGSVDFYRNYTEYSDGFGTLNGEFWLGLRYIQEMTSQGKHELRLEITAADGETVYELFKNFGLSEAPDYTLKLGKQTVRPLSANKFGFKLSKGCQFSTYDRDVDKSFTRNCGEMYRGGWWFWDCAQANLNGEYLIPPGSKSLYDIGYGGFIYYAFRGTNTLKASKLMFRRQK